MCLFVFSMAVEFLWSHTTESMCVGYMSAQDGKAKVSGELGRNPDTLQPGRDLQQAEWVVPASPG